jgi:hypothetical protein
MLAVRAGPGIAGMALAGYNPTFAEEQKWADLPAHFFCSDDLMKS